MSNSKKDIIARIISTLFVPPSFTILIFTYFAFALESETTKRITVIVVAFTFGFSFLIILFLFLRRKGRIADEDASVKEERTVPYTVAVLFYIIGLIIFIISDINLITIAFWFCYITNTLIITLINKRWKISAHSMGAAGPLAALTFYLGFPALIFSLIVFAVGWSRIQLKCHTFAQVAGGILFGFFSTYIQMYLIINLL